MQDTLVNHRVWPSTLTLRWSCDCDSTPKKVRRGFSQLTSEVPQVDASCGKDLWAVPFAGLAVLLVLVGPIRLNADSSSDQLGIWNE